jgi:hypothetical protein
VAAGDETRASGLGYEKVAGPRGMIELRTRSDASGKAIAAGGKPASRPEALALADLDGDGKADILWQNSGSGQLYVWLMNGTTLVSSGSPATVSDSKWLIK